MISARGCRGTRSLTFIILAEIRFITAGLPSSVRLKKEVSNYASPELCL
jgi:hypothetical protein